MVEKGKFYYYALCALFWVLATWGFVTNEIPGLAGLVVSIRLLIDVAVIVLGVSALRNRRDFYIILSFFVLTFVSSMIINGEPLTVYLNGVREYVGLLFIIPLLRYILTSPEREAHINGFNRQIILFLVLQMVAIPFQALKYGVGDHGGGTLGDGCSGALSTIIYMATFYLMTRNWDPENYMRSLYVNRRYLLLLIPSFLNETKISFIYLFMFFLLLFAFSWKSVFKFIVALPFILIALLGLGQLYLNAAQMDAEYFVDPDFYKAYLIGDDTDRLLEFSENYQDGDYYELEDQWAVDLPRFFKIMNIPQMLDHTKGGLLFGVGNGQFKGGNSMDKTPFARKNEIWFRGTIPLTVNIIVQMGILGLIWFFADILTALRFRKPSGRMSMNVKMYLMSIVILQLFYGTLLTYPVVDLFFFYIALNSSPLVEREPESESESTPQIAS